MKKRNLSFICAAALVLTMTACSHTTTSSTTSTSTAVESETTEAAASSDTDHTAPEKAEGSNEPSDSNSTPPEKPDGDNAPGDSNGTPPDKPDGDNAGQPGGFGGSGEVTQGDSANTLDSDGTYSDKSYSSTGDDENALRIDGATVTLDGITVDKSSGSSSNTEDGDFYGMNAALLATDGATVTIKNATVTSSAQNISHSSIQIHTFYSLVC